MKDYDDHDKKKEVAVHKPAYKNTPVSFTCQECDYQGYTLVEQKATYISFILILILLVLFNAMFTFLLIPLIVLLTRNFHHKCPNCMKEVGCDHKLLSILDLQDKAVTINIGEVGILVTRKIILAIILVLGFGFIIYTKVSHAFEPSIYPMKDTWNDYLEICKKSEIYTSGAKFRHCYDRYTGKTAMGWKGFVMRLDEGRGSRYSYRQKGITILVRMDPSDSDHDADISLFITSEKAQEFGDLITSLNRGAEIGFNATIVAVGDNTMQRHFHAAGIWKENGYMEIPDIPMEGKRYPFRPSHLPSDSDGFLGN